MKCFHELNPGVELLMNWHIIAIAHHLEMVRLGMIKRLIINLPPRSLKSIIGSVAFPAFLLGHDPAKRVIVASYASELAIKHANDFRTVINSPMYRRLFQDTRISKLKNTETELVTTRHGYRLAASIDGTLTGRGASTIIVDDPLKPSEALSDNRREKVNDFFFNTLLSRLDDKRSGAIVVIMQRLHMHDLTGKLLSSPEDWTHLDLPAIAIEDQRIPTGPELFHLRREGEVLHPDREPLAILESIKSQMGSDIFSAQYQQRPVPPGGAMIKRSWVLRYDSPPLPAPSSRCVQSWDTGSKDGPQNDWSVCTTWLVEKGKYYLLHVLRGRFDYPTLKNQAIGHAKVHKPYRIIIEDTGVGTALISELKREGLPVIKNRPVQSKITRMAVESAKFESGQIILPRQAPWLADLEAELFAFPNASHDDQVDSISQALADATSGYDSTYSWV